MVTWCSKSSVELGFNERYNRSKLNRRLLVVLSCFGALKWLSNRALMLSHLLVETVDVFDVFWMCLLYPICCYYSVLITSNTPQTFIMSMVRPVDFNIFQQKTRRLEAKTSALKALSLGGPVLSPSSPWILVAPTGAIPGPTSDMFWKD